MLSRLLNMIKKRVKRVSLMLETRQFHVINRMLHPQNVHVTNVNKRVLVLTVNGRLQMVVL
jgi:hypothetical protein